MRLPGPLAVCVLLLCAPIRAALGQQPAGSDVAARVAAQNELFEEQYQTDLKLSPQMATAYGDYRYNDQLDDDSLAGNVRQHAADEAHLARLQAISTAGFPDQDELSHDLLVRTLQQRIADFNFKEYEMPLNQRSGIHLNIADLPIAVPLDSVKHYEDYIARLHQVPRVFRQTEEVLRAGMKDNLMPVKFLLEKVPAQCQGIIAADPFLTPTRQYPSSVSAGDRQRLTKAITEAVNNEVLPAYKSFAAFIANEYASHGRTALAVTSLPDGRARYQNYIRYRTTTDLTPEQIHKLGLSEMDRIQAEMLVIAKKEGFADLASFRAWLASNPRYMATSSEQIVDDFRKYIAEMQPRLPQLFTVIPTIPVTVEAIPAFQPGQSTHYQQGTPDGKRPGRVSVQTSDPTHRSLIDDEAIAYHEGVPGHHMQISVAETLTGLPKFRLHSYNSAYIEGWGLYAEGLGKEVGLYQDPVSDYGRLSSELFRAVRLVVDTGIHAQGWTRDQVVDFMRKSGAVDEPTLQAETDRYIASPAQALSYKLGELRLRELRERAEKELGPRFDLRTFHDEMLSGGVLPLDLLDDRTSRWIAAQKAGAVSH
jgi:uncharacterized protein (DUF885 family)